MDLDITEVGAGEALVVFVHGVLGRGSSFDHVADLLTFLDGRLAVVVGHSFGGVTAMGAAVRAPGAVDALVLYETSMAWVPSFDDRVMQAVLSADDPDVAGLRMMLGDRYDAMSQ